MITKTYAAEMIYSIQEVSVVFPALRTRSEKKKNYQSGKNASSSQKSFSEILEDAKKEHVNQRKYV